ncbi:unnamed protein product [Symbiodinium microadriaticum]|nr:unnamed protein product [Symbiodinium microadriaticum]
MLACEVYGPRNFVALIHFGANVLWQFLTLNATIEEVFRTVDVITIMPLLFSGLHDIAPAEQHLQIQVMGISTFVLASLATVFMRQYNLLTQGFGLLAFLFCFLPAQRALDQACQEAGQKALLLFLIYALLFVLHLWGDSKAIPGMMNLTEAGTALGFLLSLANLYDAHTGQMIGGLMNATFGNAVEMMVTVNAIKAFTPSHNLDEGFFVPP